MPRTATVLEVLIASPGDVGTARDVISETIHDWNAVHSRSTGVVLQPVRWETHSHPELGDRAQAIINKQIVDAADLLIGVFWTRLGTDTGLAPSGTAEEISRFVVSKRPVALYFSDEPAQLQNLDLNEYQRLKDFKNEIEKNGLLARYSSTTDLRLKLARHLVQMVNSILQTIEVLPVSLAKPQTDDERFAERCLQFRNSRVGGLDKEGKKSLGDIYLNKTPAKIPLSSLFTAIHAFPSNAFDKNTRYDLTKIADNHPILDALNGWEPPKNWRGTWTLNHRFNSEGLLLYHEKLDYCEQYIQFRNDGIIEAVDHGLMGQVLHSRVIPGHAFEAGLLKIVPALVNVLRTLGATLPILLALSVRGDFEYIKLSYSSDGSNESERIGLKDELLLLPVVLIRSFGDDFVELLHPCFDALARAGGLAGSPRYSK